MHKKNSCVCLRRALKYQALIISLFFFNRKQNGWVITFWEIYLVLQTASFACFQDDGIVKKRKLTRSSHCICVRTATKCAFCQQSGKGCMSAAVLAVVQIGGVAVKAKNFFRGVGIEAEVVEMFINVHDMGCGRGEAHKPPPWPLWLRRCQRSAPELPT